MMTSSRSQPVISVFGSSAPRPGSDAYVQAQELGRRLAEAGFAVATGGYEGTMMAVSQGAASARGHVIGVTSDQIERFRAAGPNPYVVEQVRYATLRDRLLHLVTHNQGMVVLPGGVGTLSEMALAWSFLQTGEIPARPLVLLGAMWFETVVAYQQGGYVTPRDAALLSFAATPAAAVSLIIDRCAQ